MMNRTELARIISATTTATALSAELPSYPVLNSYDLVGSDMKSGTRGIRFDAPSHPELRDQDFWPERLLIGALNGRYMQQDRSGNTDIVFPYIEITSRNYPMFEINGVTELILDPIEAVALYRLAATMEGFDIRTLNAVVQGMGQSQSDLLAKYRTENLPAFTGNAHHGRSWLQYLAYTQR